MTIEANKDTDPKPRVLDAKTIINNPHELLEYLGEGWVTEEEDYNNRSFSHRIDDANSNMFIRFSRDKDTKEISVSTILNTDYSQNKFSARIGNATLLTLANDLPGWEGFIKINSRNYEDQLDLRTKEHKAIFLTASGSRIEGSSFL